MLLSTHQGCQQASKKDNLQVAVMLHSRLGVGVCVMILCTSYLLFVPTRR